MTHVDRRSRRARRPCLRAGWRLLACAAALCLRPAHAALTENLAVSPVAMSMGNAVTADPPGIDSIHFNPAGLALITKDTRSDTVFAAQLRTNAKFTQPAGFDIGGWTVDPLAGTESEGNKQLIYLPIVDATTPRLPFAAAAGLGLALHNEGSPWTFATATYVPQGVGIDRTSKADDPARFDGRQVVMQRLVYLSPSVGYKFNDEFSVGLSIPIAHQAFALDTDMRMPNQLLGIIGQLQKGWCGNNGNPLDSLAFGLCGTNSQGQQSGMLNPFAEVGEMRFNGDSPADITYNIGALWQPDEHIGFGAVYQSGSNTVITGRFNFRADPMLPEFVRHMYQSLLGPIVASMFGFPTSIPTEQSGRFQMVLPYPQHWQFGLKLKPVDTVQFDVDAGWTDWGKWSSLTMQFDQEIKLLDMARIFGQYNPAELVMPRGYRSVWSYGFGLQVQATDALKLRFGFEPRNSSVPSDKLDLIAPMPRLPIESMGLAYELKNGMKLESDFSFAKGHFNEPAGTDCNLNCTNFFNVVYNPYAGLDVAGTLVVRYGGVKITQPF